MNFSREWDMASADTFSVPSIGAFVKRHRHNNPGVSIDPFARNQPWATHTNDLNPETAAQHHMHARDFLAMLVTQGVRADLIIFDPPYSPRQVSEVYSSIGVTATMEDTQTGRLKKECRELFRQLLKQGGTVLSFGWNTVGMGPGFVTDEILLVCHGGDHNDTICMAERFAIKQGDLFRP